MSYEAGRFALPGLTPAIRWLVLANVVVFAANALLLGRLSDPVAGGGAWFGCSLPRLLDGYGLGLLTLFSYQFTHAFTDPLHLLLNLLVLWLFGSMVEPRLGSRGTVLLYLTGGIAGAGLHFAVATLQGSAAIPLVGASGACYAFLLYAACAEPRTPVLLLLVQVPLWLLAALLVGLGLYSSFVEFATGSHGVVAHGAHLGGALLGAVAQRFGFWQQRRGAANGWFGGLAEQYQQRQRRRAAARAEHLDRILAKVQAEGLQALSAAERRFLQRQSAQSRRQQARLVSDSRAGPAARG